MNLKTIFLSIFFLSTLLSVNSQETTWEIDKSHSSINFAIKHFKIATIKGNFDDFSGKIISNEEDFTNANFDVIIQTASINTNQEARDTHLKNADFFDAEKNPEITFKSTSVTKKSEKTYAIKGNLTVNGITKEFEFTASFAGSFVHPRFKHTVGVFNLDGILNRSDYNIGSKFPAAALGEDIKISVAIEMKKA